MKERPILFSAPMVRALLAGMKTQTRRTIKSQPEEMIGGSVRWPKQGHSGPDGYLRGVAADFWCPHGKVGDTLWVREAWFVGKGYDAVAGSTFKSPAVWYGADGAAPADRAGRYRHARFMPRWASRITLEITGVRVERLQEISEADALAEGAVRYTDKDPDYGYAGWYRELWESINGAGSWAANPWVWALTFNIARA